jgi:hypothetical protein
MVAPFYFSRTVKGKFQRTIFVTQYFYCELGFINDEEKCRRRAQPEVGYDCILV